MLERFKSCYDSIYNKLKSLANTKDVETLNSVNPRDIELLSITTTGSSTPYVEKKPFPRVSRVHSFKEMVAKENKPPVLPGRTIN